jgi:Na+-driven multidrug efflux pump
LRLHAQIDRQLITIGAPAGAEMLARHLAQAVVLKLAALHGTAAVAALGIVFRLFSFAFMPLVGLHMGGATVAGQNLGAEQLPRVHATARAALLVGLIAAVVLSLAGWLLAWTLAGIFTTDAETLRAAVPLVRVFCLVLVIVAVTFGLGTVFSGAGYTVPFLVSALVAKFGAQVPFLILLRLAFGLPLLAVWLSFLGSELIELVVVLLFYRAGRWKAVRV